MKRSFKKKPDRSVLKSAPYKYIAICDLDDREIDDENEDYLVNSTILAHGGKDYVMEVVTKYIIDNKLTKEDVYQGLKIFKVGEPQAVSCAIVREPQVTLDF